MRAANLVDFWKPDTREWQLWVVNSTDGRNTPLIAQAMCVALTG